MEKKRSFKRLKRALCRNYILQHPNFHKKFRITTDASEFSIGAVPTQEREEMDLPVAYFSKALVGAARNYDVTEKECLAVIHALEHFRPFLYGTKFVLSCYHEPLRIINWTVNHTLHMTKWILRLPDYQYDFECTPGKINRWISGLSENPSDNVVYAQENIVSLDSDNEIETIEETFAIKITADNSKTKLSKTLNRLLEENLKKYTKVLKQLQVLKINRTRQIELGLSQILIYLQLQSVNKKISQQEVDL